MAWGGPVAQIGMLKQELVEEEQWISKEKFNRALAVYQVLPGPEAQELCVFFGMTKAGRWGGFLAGLGFMLPGFLLMLLLTWIYVTIGIKSPELTAIFTGFQIAVISLIFRAVHRIGSHTLHNSALIVTAVLSFTGYLAQIPFYIVLPIAGTAYMLWRLRKKFASTIIAITFLIYCITLFCTVDFQKTTITIKDKQTTVAINQNPAAVFISGLKAGSLTFGGAYTVIPFIQEDAVRKNNWLGNEQFLDGIALSGILPAPLIIFSTFVGYFGYGWTGAILITIGIFLPAFSFTLIGHNLMEKLIEKKELHSFLDGVTAGVVALISITAIQLFFSTVNGWIPFILFTGGLIYLFMTRNKYAPVILILFSGFISWMVFQ